MNNTLKINIDESDKFRAKKSYCNNCGKLGHRYKDCNDPITSFGIALIKINIDDNRHLFKQLTSLLQFKPNCFDRNCLLSASANGIQYNSQNDIKIFCQFRHKIQFLLIRRKHTLGFIEFIRGRYFIENVDGIIFLFRQMTTAEIKIIGENNFDFLWANLWSITIHDKTPYHNEYLSSKQKFDKLKSGNNNFLSLDFYVNNVHPIYNSAEWGFPKGRRNFQESNFLCALREFKEETGFLDNEFSVLNKLQPFHEKLIGTNGINYKHVYYPAITQSQRTLEIDPSNPPQFNEIGDIGWFTYDEAMNLIRPYHTERKKILTVLYMFLINFISKNS